MIEGGIFVGAETRRRAAVFHALHPASNEVGQIAFSESSSEDVSQACALAAHAFGEFSASAPQRRAALLDRVAEEMIALGDVLIETAMAETGLPRLRLENERGRTTGQLKLFAETVRAGDWLDAAIDRALPDRQPAPRADLRRMNAALGPVAVFGASNFPLAFSVAGGDTASAFAAGCPVVVKGHPAHPGTGELVARIMRTVVAACGFPAGVFSYLPGASHALGAALADDANIKAIAFTGSRKGGLALADIAAKRKEPIPVYAEMSSINPVILAPAALAARAEAIASGFIGSLTLGAGQFCTNPGLVLAIDGPDLDRFIKAAASALSDVNAAVMLTPGICEAFGAGVASLEDHREVQRVSSGRTSSVANSAPGALFETSGAAFLNEPALAREVFGASSLVVRCRDADQLFSVIARLEGQLTITLHVDDADKAFAALLLPLVQTKAGRVLANGWPTGVEVTHAMVHGGPFPATSDTRTTSVGTLAMMRFLRPVCFQDVPDALLPPPLQQANPWKIPRRLDGKLVTP